MQIPKKFEHSLELRKKYCRRNKTPRKMLYLYKSVVIRVQTRILNRSRDWTRGYTGCLKKNAMEIQQAVVHHKRG
jgi:hypothetical protein